MAKNDLLEKGQKRMIHIKIWQNEEFATLSPLARLLYIGLITLADDDGRLKGNSALIKSQIFPFDAKMTIEIFKNLLKEVVKTKFIEIYRVKSDYFIEHLNWKRYQWIRKELYKPSFLPENPSQKCCETATEMGTKIRQDKIRQDKESNTLTYLSEIPEPDMQEWLQRFDVSRHKIKSKAEDFLLYCKSNAKWYADPKSALLNAMKKDFTEKKKTQPVQAQDEIPKVHVPIPQDIKDQIRKITRGMKV